MKLCGRAESEECGGERKECVYAAIQKLLNQMKEDIARVQNIAYADQIVVAKIYDVTANVLADACRRNLKLDAANCEPSKQAKPEQITMDTFILLNQLKEDRFITEEYKQILFDALLKINPAMKKLVDEDRDKGLI